MRACPRCGARYAGGEVCPKDGTALLEPSRDPLIGATLGDYQPLELVGSGGMAQVYRARHLKRGGQYALKVLAGPGTEEVLEERFVREVRAIQQIAHPNVVTLVDWGTTPSGRRFLVMEWVEGRELSDAIRSEAPFHPLRAANVARQIASGLVAIHDAGFVHRDVKPHNVMLFGASSGPASPREQVKIVDFGLVYADPNLWNRLTRAGDIVGTPFYMAPETIEGAEADARTDLYSLGVILYEMLAGHVPFSSPAIPEILAKHLREAPAELPECGGLDTIAHDLLAKSPARRPQTAREVVERIDALDLTLTQTSPSRAPSLLTMVTEPGVRRATIEARAATLDPATDLGLARAVALGDTAPHAAPSLVFEPRTDHQSRAPAPATRPVSFGGATAEGPEQLATTISPPTAPQELTEEDQDATRAQPAPAGLALGDDDATGAHAPRRPSSVAVDDEDATGALVAPSTTPAARAPHAEGDDEEEPGAAPTFVGTSDDLTSEGFDAPSDTPHLPLAVLPAPAPPPTVTVGPAVGGAPPVPVIRVHAPRDTPREALRDGPREGARDYAKDLAREAGREPAGQARDTAPREAPLVREVARDAARDPAKDGTREGAKDAARDGAREAVKVDITPARATIAGVPLLAIVAALVFLVAVVAGVALFQVVRSSDREPRVVQVKLPSDTKPRAIARRPAAEPRAEAQLHDASPARDTSQSRDASPARDASPGAKAAPRAERDAAPARAAAPVTLAEVGPELRRLAAQRGFEVDELADVPEVAPKYVELQRATASGDLVGARAALAEVEAALATRSPDLELLRRRSEALASQLHAARAHLDRGRLDALESRYLELSARITASPTPAEIPDVLRALRALRADLTREEKPGTSR